MASIKLLAGKACVLRFKLCSLFTDVTLVGPDWFSSFDSREYGNHTIHANHMNMCLFINRQDDGYGKVQAKLAKYVHEIEQRIRATLKPPEDAKFGPPLPYAPANALVSTSAAPPIAVRQDTDTYAGDLYGLSEDEADRQEHKGELPGR